MIASLYQKGSSSRPTRWSGSVAMTPVPLRRTAEFPMRCRDRAVGRTTSPLGVIGEVGVDQQLPVRSADRLRQREPDEVMMSIHHHQQSGVLAVFTDAGRLGAAVSKHAEAVHGHVAPLLRLHLGVRSIDPGHIFDAQLLVVNAG